MKGTKWVYKGVVKWQVENKVMEKNISWSMEVIDSFQTNDILIAKIKGHPDDMAWYKEGKMPSERAIIWDGKNYYEIQYGKTYDELVEIYNKSKNDFLSLLNSNNLILPIPLKEGKSWGDEDLPPREDSMYCWIVFEISKKKIKAKGINPRKFIKSYLIAYRTLPDHTFIEYGEGIGILRYEYGHHGTVSECDMKLVEFKKGK